MNHPRIGRLLLGGLLLGSLWMGAPSTPLGGLIDQPRAAPVQRALPYRGAASCASAACHGDSSLRGTKRCEYTLWTAKDKHAQAYQVLLTERSRIIAANYLQKTARPEKEPLCLRCHSLDAQAALQGDSIAYADGISCERCHGPAEKWLTQHYLPAWKEKSDSQKRDQFGFQPLKDMLVRVQVCLQCHIGSGAQEVNHDLMAAGHPRLMFEFGAYLAIMPPHWDLAAEQRRVPDGAARVWALGQVAATQQALQLLEHRANAQKTGASPWPEFSEYECLACHHDLRQPSWRQQRGYPGRIPGSFPWATWYLPLLPRALALAPQTDDDKLSRLLDSLRREMETPLPDRDKVSAQAHEAARLLRSRAATLNAAKASNPVTLQNVFNDIRKDQVTPQRNWDAAAQTFLALVALDRRPTDAKLQRAFRTMIEELRYPRTLSSPHAADPRMFFEQLQDLSKLPGH